MKKTEETVKSKYPMMLEIIGGTYYEYCADPHWDELFGSGLRAVNALSSHGRDLHFHTYADKEVAAILKHFANALEFTFTDYPVQKSVTFSYRHPLSNPSFAPSDQLDVEMLMEVTTTNDLIVFGMVEGNAVVHGGRVVYDPQSPGNPLPFKHNGSTAKELAIVLNLAEAEKITKTTGINNIAEQLMNSSDASVVVLKMGALGANVFTANNLNPYIVHPFITDQVWPIGSGDIFTAIFGFEWLVNNAEPRIAAEKASLATANYVNSRTLPIPELLNKSFKPFSKGRKIGTVYLAGPFFNMGERWLIDEFYNHLINMDIDVFSPLHDVGYGEAEKVAAEDLRGLDDCQLVVAILNGLDAGTLFEIGYAQAKNIPVLIFCENEKEVALTMMKGSGYRFFTDFTTLIYHTYWTLYKL